MGCFSSVGDFFREEVIDPLLPEKAKDVASHVVPESLDILQILEQDPQALSPWEHLQETVLNPLKEALDPLRPESEWVAKISPMLAKGKTADNLKEGLREMYPREMKKALPDILTWIGFYFGGPAGAAVGRAVGKAISQELQDETVSTSEVIEAGVKGLAYGSSAQGLTNVVQGLSTGVAAGAGAPGTGAGGATMGTGAGAGTGAVGAGATGGGLTLPGFGQGGMFATGGTGGAFGVPGGQVGPMTAQQATAGNLGNTLGFLPGFGEGFGGNTLGNLIAQLGFGQAGGGTGGITLENLFGGGGQQQQGGINLSSLFGGQQQGGGINLGNLFGSGGGQQGGGIDWLSLLLGGGGLIAMNQQSGPQLPTAPSYQPVGLPSEFGVSSQALQRLLGLQPEQFKLPISNIQEALAAQQAEQFGQYQKQIRPVLAQQGQLDSTYYANLLSDFTRGQQTQALGTTADLLTQQALTNQQMQQWLPEFQAGVAGQLGGLGGVQFGQQIGQRGQEFQSALVPYQTELAGYFNQLNQRQMLQSALGSMAAGSVYRPQWGF